MRNTDLPTGVSYAFHALSLDESRLAFKPTLWYQPVDTNSESKKDNFKTVLKQCWFSGEHSDIGGGKKNPELSNISLAWMISQLTRYNLLDFDPDYLLKSDNMDYDHGSRQRWVTINGEGGKWWEGQNLLVRIVLSVFYVFVDYLVEFATWLGINGFLGVRTPGMYHREGYKTNEFLHSSVADRWLEYNGNEQQGIHWPCRSLTNWRLLGSKNDDPRIWGKYHKNHLLHRLQGEIVHTLGGIQDGNGSRSEGPRIWVKSQNGQNFSLREEQITDVELRCKNNIRNTSPNYG